MERFAELLDNLVYTRSRDRKIGLIAEYLRETPDPDRGWALAALAGTLSIATVKNNAIRNMADERFDPALFRMSRDYVGDTAETVALLWDQLRRIAEAGRGHRAAQQCQPRACAVLACRVDGPAGCEWALCPA
jgi:AAA+ superfamily predicted ATPase